MIKQPFFPHYGTNQVVTVGAGASSSVTLDRYAKQVHVVNSGANKGYFRVFNSADGAQSASAIDCPVIANGAITVTKGEQDSISCFSAAGTTFEVMTGEGF